MDKRFIGIEIGGTKLQLVAGNTSGRILSRVRLKVSPQDGAEGICTAIRNSIDDLINSNQPLAIGVGFGGPIDLNTGNILCSHQIEGWTGFPLKTWLEDLTALPIFMDNDANTAALGEAMRGAGCGADPLRCAKWLD